MSYTGFTEAPSSQEVFVGQEAMFRCHHSTAYFIAWVVNGSALGLISSPDIMPGINNLIEMMMVLW